MYITVVHEITEPSTFWSAAQEAMSQPMPEGVALHGVFPSSDGTHAVCLWEAPDQQAVREMVESVVGQVSKNDYHEVDAVNAVGLPA
ncbi:hypothetical protein [Actinomycetospora cinnamomea]|uniref:DUF4242 domain-containing protein n=1 Tax=Actinomycetospora cinnamomea TaxID=663609 RepID=A0A2U1FG55_9PSEU|nr:hypothetical protein [Actinomycetospora cinnamomea]PVZ11129.1 hypothetical protein C8D89_104343 [Actinomycetospora cinnamomea]